MRFVNTFIMIFGESCFYDMAYKFYSDFSESKTKILFKVIFLSFFFRLYFSICVIVVRSKNGKNDDKYARHYSKLLWPRRVVEELEKPNDGANTYSTRKIEMKRALTHSTLQWKQARSTRSLCNSI